MAPAPNAKNTLLDVLFESCHTPIAYMDLDFNFIRVNQAYASADEKEISFFPGKNHFELYPDQENQKIFENVVKTGESYSVSVKAFEYVDTPERGETFWDWSLTVVIDSKGKAAGLLLQLLDVSAQVRIEQKLYEKVKKELHSYDEELETIIEARTKSLQEAIEQLEYENNKRKKTEALMQKAKEEAECANVSKSQFLSRMSHELRTPLNAILGFSQLLELNHLNEKQASFNAEILSAGNHLLSMISDILDLSRIETGNFIVSVTDVSLSRIIKESISLVEHKLGFKNITIHNLVSSEDKITIKADETRLKEVLVNLLSNAVKYNSVNGLISIGYKLLEDGNIRTHVSDTGKGLTAKEQIDVFEPFNRLGAEYTDIEGVGIGLTISKKLMELMSGSISIESETGQGSTFYIDCPAGHKTERNVSEQTKINVEDEFLRDILYVEDNRSNQVIIKNLFSDNPKFNLTIADSAEEGLKLVEQVCFDLIILDINLPGMDGYQALDEFKKNAETKDVPVIALSAAAGESDVKKGLNAGFNQYVTKPVNLYELLKVIRQEVSGQVKH